MPTLPRPGKQSLFDMVEQNKATAAAAAAAQKQADEDANATLSTQQQQEQDEHTRSPKQQQHDPEVSSIFTQSTIADTGNPVHQETTSSSRFSLFRRSNKSHTSSTSTDQQTLLSSSSSDQTPAPKQKEKEQEKRKSRFENPFKPHQQTDQDRAIMEKLAKRLGSKEEAVRLGGAQPAGYRGVGGGYAAGGPWSGGM